MITTSYTVCSTCRISSAPQVDRPDAVATLPDSEVTATTVACGMAVTAGLWTAACVASAAGYPSLGGP